MNTSEHLLYSIQDWLNQVNDRNTILGYWNWVVKQIEQAEQAEQAEKVETIEFCPECKQPLRTKSLYEGGGVECTNKDCGYWFCF